MITLILIYEYNQEAVNVYNFSLFFVFKITFSKNEK